MRSRPSARPEMIHFASFCIFLGSVVFAGPIDPGPGEKRAAVPRSPGKTRRPQESSLWNSTANSRIVPEFALGTDKRVVNSARKLAKEFG
jgi:hypothetical protein